MECREEDPGYPVAEKGEKHPAAAVPASQSFAVCQVKEFAVYLGHQGLIVDRDTALLCEITLHPHVMVACKDMDSYAAVSQCGQTAQEAGESFWDHLFVFPPEIKQVAQQPY